MSMTNWVERRALREEHLRNASFLWQSVKSAIDECCNSYRENFSGLAQVQNQEQNGHRMLIIVRRISGGNSRQISVAFSDQDKLIRVTVDGQRAEASPIDADELHSFIKRDEKEITPEEFTQVVLEEHLFDEGLREF